MAQNSSARWARWEWSKVKRGRWHRLFADGDLAKTACGAARKNSKHVAVETAGQPTGGKVCETCALFDGLHQKLVTVTDVIAKAPTFTLADILADAPATTVTAQVAPQATDGRPVAPKGYCPCGCDQSDEARAYRAALADWERAERERKEAEFAAFLQGKAVAA